METSFYVVLVTVFVLDLWAITAINRSHLYERRQIGWQTVVVLLVPAIGSLLVLLMLWSQRSSPSREKSDTVHEHWQNPQD
jgi:NADH:ubiquinone oxidoreductase subunit 6 (subunit J)